VVAIIVIFLSLGSCALRDPNLFDKVSELARWSNTGPSPRGSLTSFTFYTAILSWEKGELDFAVYFAVACVVNLADCECLSRAKFSINLANIVMCFCRRCLSRRELTGRDCSKAAFHLVREDRP